MRVVVLSDTHNFHERLNIPEGDVLIHAGDFTSIGKTSEIIAFNHWMRDLPHRHKLVCAGNHDILLETESNYAEGLLTDVTYLRDEYRIIDSIKIYVSPWQPTFGNWVFNVPRGKKIKEKWDLIPEDTNILVTHGSPYGILDKTTGGGHVGCEELAIAVNRIKPKYHIFGHIHEGYGRIETEDTIFINCSICDKHYNPVNFPIILEV